MGLTLEIKILSFSKVVIIMKKLVLIITLSLFATYANAYEVKKICAKYRTNYSWSQPYQVKAQIYSGQELNQATGNPLGNYDMFSHYAVIWWSQNQASLIQINDIYVAGGMLFNGNGIDQQGRQWELSDSMGMCI